MENNENGNGFNYVEQKIKPKGRKRLKKVLLVAGTALLAAVIFGFTARLVFTASEGPVNRLLGITPTPTLTPTEKVPVNRNEVTLAPTDTGTPTPTSTPTPSPTPTETPVTLPVTLPDEPTGEPDPEPTGIEPTASPAPTAGPDDGSGDNAREDDPIRSYMAMTARMRGVADKASESLVKVYAITSGINWMDESVESRTERTGVLFADNGVELLIVVEYSAVSSADRIEIGFRDGKTAEAAIFAADPDTGLAVLGVELSQISASTAATCKYITIGDTEGVYEGEPVIAVGRPNGYYGAVEFCFVSHTGILKYYVDGVEERFTTDMLAVDGSDGIIIDLEGKLVGFISATEDAALNTSFAVNINSLRTILVKLLNGSPIPYFGVRAENVPADILESMGLENGIYVNEVIASSPAASANVKKGDVIVMLDDTKICSMTDFNEYILGLDAESEVRVQIYHSGMRNETAEEITVVLTEK